MWISTCADPASHRRRQRWHAGTLAPPRMVLRLNRHFRPSMHDSATFNASTHQHHRWSQPHQENAVYATRCPTLHRIGRPAYCHCLLHESDLLRRTLTTAARSAGHLAYHEMSAIVSVYYDWNFETLLRVKREALEKAVANGPLGGLRLPSHALFFSLQTLDATSRFLQPSANSPRPTPQLALAQHSSQSRWPSFPARLCTRPSIAARIFTLLEQD